MEILYLYNMGELIRYDTMTVTELQYAFVTQSHLFMQALRTNESAETCKLINDEIDRILALIDIKIHALLLRPVGKHQKYSRPPEGTSKELQTISRSG